MAEHPHPWQGWERTDTQNQTTDFPGLFLRDSSDPGLSETLQSRSTHVTSLPSAHSLLIPKIIEGRRKV